MNDVKQLVASIREAFSSVEYPGDWCLRGSSEGTEPFLLEKEFRGKDDWRKLDAKFIDSAPDGFATALGFFSDEAFRFYLPAYLIADLEGHLERVNPVFHLTHGLEAETRNKPINPRRYGERTWFEHARHKFAIFNDQQRIAIAGYLAYRRAHADMTDHEKHTIRQALQGYWHVRVA